MVPGGVRVVVVVVVALPVRMPVRVCGVVMMSGFVAKVLGTDMVDQPERGKREQSGCSDTPDPMLNDPPHIRLTLSILHAFYRKRGFQHKRTIKWSLSRDPVKHNAPCLSHLEQALEEKAGERVLFSV